MIELIGKIILYSWLIPGLLAYNTLIIAGMATEETLWPFEDWYDPFVIALIIPLWPIVIGAVFQQYRTERKQKLNTIKESIEVHYRDRWYE